MYIGRTITVVDSNFQQQMDEDRPFTEFRQTIPPKFAKTLISYLQLNAPLKDKKILDPFCGSGTILQFAHMIGLQAYGADIVPKCIEGTRNNVKFTANLLEQNISQTPGLSAL